MVTGAAMVVATSFNMRSEIPSGPLDLLSLVGVEPCTSSVHSKLLVRSGVISEGTALLCISGTFNGVRDVLKQLEKDVLAL